MHLIRCASPVNTARRSEFVGAEQSDIDGDAVADLHRIKTADRLDGGGRVREKFVEREDDALVPNAKMRGRSANFA